MSDEKDKDIPIPDQPVKLTPPPRVIPEPHEFFLWLKNSIYRIGVDTGGISPPPKSPMPTIPPFKLFTEEPWDGKRQIIEKLYRIHKVELAQVQDPAFSSLRDVSSLTVLPKGFQAQGSQAPDRITVGGIQYNKLAEDLVAPGPNSNDTSILPRVVIFEGATYVRDIIK